MKVIKNINNNVALCVDSQNREVVAFGKGLGFAKPPYEIPLKNIERTFYNVNQNYLDVIAELPADVIEVSAKILDYANLKMETQYQSNVILTLADHIEFSIKRKQKNIQIKLPLVYEIRQLYPKEMKIGLEALQMIKKDLHIELPEGEAASIALHLIDYGVNKKNIDNLDENLVVEKCTEIIEDFFHIQINKEGFNYFRFVSHMHYLLGRKQNNEEIDSDNEKMFDLMKKEFSKIYTCALEINKYITSIYKKTLQNEDMLYLMLHLNRLSAREEYTK